MEPWGWAPATDDARVHRPFLWSREEAVEELARIREDVAGCEMPRLREQENARVQRDKRERADRPAGPLPGVSVRVVGMPDRAPPEPPPYKRRSEEELTAQARRIAEGEWSIQEYDVPPSPRPGQGWVPPAGAYS